MADLEAKLAGARAAGARFILAITDGVFSMEGELAPLPEIVAACERHGAVLVVDDSHATGLLGARGRGTAEELGVWGKVPIHTGTLGKAMGSAMGGYVTGPRAVVDTLRQRSRPYLFSNSLAAGGRRGRDGGVPHGHGGPLPHARPCRRTPATSASA